MCVNQLYRISLDRKALVAYSSVKNNDNSMYLYSRVVEGLISFGLKRNIHEKYTKLEGVSNTQYGIIRIISFTWSQVITVKKGICSSFLIHENCPPQLPKSLFQAGTGPGVAWIRPAGMSVLN